MPEQTEVITLVVDDKPVADGVGRANRNLKSYRDAGVEANKEIASSSTSLIRKILDVVEVAGLAKTAISGVRFAAQEIKAPGGLDALLNGFRAARVAISPTIFTGVTVAAGIAIEQTAKAVIAQGKLIDAQSVAAAKANLYYEQYQKLDFLAKRSGAETETFVNAFDALVSRRSNNDEAKAALSEIGVEVTDVRGKMRDASTVFGEVGVAIDKIKDPADRARIVLSILGNEVGSKILPDLDKNLRANSDRFDDWALALDSDSRIAVTRLRDELRDLKKDFSDVGNAATTFAEKIRQEFVVGVSKGANALTDIARAGRQAEGGGFAGAKVGPLPGERQNLLALPSARELDEQFQRQSREQQQKLIGPEAIQKTINKFAESQLVVPHTGQGPALPLGLAAKQQAEEFGQTLDGLTKKLSELQAKRNTALEAINSGGILAGASNLALTQTNQQIAGVEAQIQKQHDLEAAEKARDAAASSAAGILQRARLEELYNGDQLLVQRDLEIKQYGVTKEAIQNLTEAYSILIRRRDETEQRQLDVKIFNDRRATDAEQGRAGQDELKKRNQVVVDSVKSTAGLQNEIADARSSREISMIQAEETARIASLGRVESSSITVRANAELQKGAIAADAALRIEKFEEESIVRRSQREIGSLQTLRDAKVLSENLFQNQRASIEGLRDEQLAKLQVDAQNKVLKEIEDASDRSAKLIDEDNHRIFDGFKHEADGVFDALVSKSRNVWSAIGNGFKTALLTSIKDITTSRIAAGLTHVATGEEVRLENDHSQTGVLGKIRSSLKIGAQPVFGPRPSELKSKLDSPNHLGDVILSSGAVPVFVANAGAFAPRAPATAAIGLGAILAGLAAAAPPPEPVRPGLVQSTFVPTRIVGESENAFGPDAGSTSPGSIFGLPGPSSSALGPPETVETQTAASPGGSLAQLLGASGLKIPGLNANGGAFESGPGQVGTGGGAIASEAKQSVGILGSLKGGLSGFKGLLTSLGGIGQGARPTNADGIPLKTVGGGKGVGGAAGGALLLGGSTLLLDGLHRGGFTGFGEDIAGGAAIGAKFGGPLGAAIGAGAGALAGLYGIFHKNATQKIVEKVKSVYGIKIDEKFAKDPLLGIIQGSFGGNIEVGIRSPQVRQLLELYAMTTGQPSGGLVQRVTPSVFTQANGQLSQTATFFNGGAVYAGGAPVAKYAGSPGGDYPTPTSLSVQSLVLSVPNGGLGALVDGRVVSGIASNGRIVAQANVSGQNSSAGRRSSAAALLSPSFVTS